MTSRSMYAKQTKMKDAAIAARSAALPSIRRI